MTHAGLPSYCAYSGGGLGGRRALSAPLTRCYCTPGGPALQRFGLFTRASPPPYCIKLRPVHGAAQPYLFDKDFHTSSLISLQFIVDYTDFSCQSYFIWSAVDSNSLSTSWLTFLMHTSGLTLPRAQAGQCFQERQRKTKTPLNVSVAG